MIPRIPENTASRVLQKAFKAGLINNDDTTLIFYDLSYLKERISDLVTLFPPSALHAIAIKANPLLKVLEQINLPGVGLEAATLAELHIARKAGFSSDRIVFDSPAKTKSELEYALKAGVYINADSLMELERIADIQKKYKLNRPVGIRINPQVGTGSISTTSVAGEFSKFGVPLNQCRQELKEAYIKNDWLRGVHLHIGSQGCAVEMLLDGIGMVFEFVHEVNYDLEKRGVDKKIDIFDMGGGLPVSYHRNEVPVSMAQYKQQLETRFHELFSGDFKLITEFGRYIHANTAWAVSRVEYVKDYTEPKTIMIHVGADLFLRTCYRPEDWHHDVTVLDKNGHLKSDGPKQKYVIAGPLCFSGDMIARDIELPDVKEGDYILIHDVGAYTMSMWSRYNSRQTPKIIGYHENGTSFEILKDRESVKDVVDFWG